MNIPQEVLKPAIHRIVAAAGSSEAEAAIVADHVIAANLKGHDSHGVVMVPTYIANVKAGRLKPNQPGRLVREDGSILVYDGEFGYGQVVARRATELGIAHAKQHGVAVLALRHSSHIGRVGTYGEMCVAAGLVSVQFVSGRGHRPRVAPFRGTDARLPTNPVCIAVPGTGRTPPIILDMATSRIAMGKVRVARNAGKRVPDGHLIDSAGRPTTDPQVMFDTPPGALTSVGEHKGYGLALMCDILAGAIAGGGTIQPGNPREGGNINSSLMFILDPARTADTDWIRAEIDAVVGYVTASPPADPALPVLIPGDPERASLAERSKSGIPLDDETIADLRQAAASVGVALELGLNS